MYLLISLPRYVSLHVCMYTHRVFKERGHAFVHRPEPEDEEDTEDATILATAWLEIYLRKTPGPSKKSESKLWVT